MQKHSTPRNGGLLNFRVPDKMLTHFIFGMGSGEPSPYGRPITGNIDGFKKVVEKQNIKQLPSQMELS